MAVAVRVPTVLRKHTAGEKLVSGDGETLRAVVDDVASRHPGLRDALLDDDGHLRRFVNVYLNDEDVRFLGGPETPVATGDVVSILPAVAGG